jgi:hypothetical protein
MVGHIGHVPDELARAHALAGDDDRIDRFIRRADGDVLDGDHPAAGEQPGVEHDAGGGREHWLAGGRREVDAAVAGLPGVLGRREPMCDVQRTRQWRNEGPRAARAYRGG